jgi:tRNA A37 threonylcarbamoyladenosine dehydratase
MLFGRDSVNKLRSRRVAVFGIGGVGGHCAEALCRTGVGALDLFDGDIVDVTNINRQIIATHRTVGRDKAEVMRERMLDINPEASVNAHKLFYLPETADKVDLTVYDYIIDAVDTVTAKIEIVRRTSALGIPVISSMGAADKLDPTLFKVADIYETSVCPLARIMRAELRKRGIESLKVVYSTEPPSKTEAVCEDDIEFWNEKAASTGRRRIPASNAFVPPVVGLIMACEVVKDLLHSPR